MAKKNILPSEFEIQCLLREWFDLQYPNIIMRCSMSGVRLPIGLAKKMKRLNPDRAWPDIFIAEPRKKYHGLYIELKKSFNDLYTKKGKYRQDKHIQEQQAVLTALFRKGYAAYFACGFQGAKNIIDDYLDRRG